MKQMKRRNKESIHEEKLPLSENSASIGNVENYESRKTWKCISFTCIIGLLMCCIYLCISCIDSPLSPEEKATLVMLKQCLRDVTISKNMKELVIPDHRCNDINSTVLDLGAFKKLQRFSVGSSSFSTVSTVRIMKLPSLQSVTIENSCFGSRNGLLRIENCDRLKELTIGDGAFRSFKHLELDSLPSLEKMTIGSDCFIEAKELDLHNLPSLESLRVGSSSFSAKEGDFLLTDCEALRELEVGENAFQYFVTFNHTNTPALSAINIGSGCFKNVDRFVLEGLPKLTTLTVGADSFTVKEGVFHVAANPVLKEVVLGKGAFSAFAQFDVATNPALERLVLDGECFQTAEWVALTDLPVLKKLTIGERCFWKKKGHFRLEACGQLQEVAIGDLAFNVFQVVEMADLPALTALEIGMDCFKQAEGLNLTWLPRLERVAVGTGSFEDKDGVFALANCPHLREVVLGPRAFANANALQLQALPALETLSVSSGSFVKGEALEVAGLDALVSLRVDHDSFSKSHGVLVLANCSRLETFAVGDNAFSEFKLELVTLPALQRIDVGRNCFRATLHLTLVDMPRLRSLFVDASSFTALGSFTVSNCPDLKEITINTFAMSHYTFSLSAAPALEVITIGDNCFDDADAFELSGLSSLRNLTVGKMAFLGKPGTFTLRDCPRLEELSVGFHSFRKFRIEALEKLDSLRLFHTDFSCFGNTERLSFAGLNHLERVVMEGDACEKCTEFAVEGCPALQELDLGDQSFQGCGTLFIRNNPHLRTLHIGEKSFPWAHEARLENLPELKRVEIGTASFAKKEGQFELKECENVKEVKIGSGSFASFSTCAIEKVEKLEVLEMGDLLDENGCFTKADLQLEGKCV